MHRLFSRQSRSFLVPAAFLAGAVALTGCGRAIGSVSGKVTHQGKVLKGGSVSFISTDGGQSFAAGIAEDGTYQVPNIASGEYKVCVETSSLKQSAGGPPPGMRGPASRGPAKDIPPPKDAQIPEGYTPSSPADMALAKMKKRYVEIPEKYSKAETTDLGFTADGGQQTFDIDLK